MTNEKAINILLAIKKGTALSFLSDEAIARAVDLAISALEKLETAKIVVGKSRGGVTLWHECSKCGEPVDAKDIFCSGCGRKLIPLSEPYTEEDNDQP